MGITNKNFKNIIKNRVCVFGYIQAEKIAIIIARYRLENYFQLLEINEPPKSHVYAGFFKTDR